MRPGFPVELRIVVADLPMPAHPDRIAASTSTPGYEVTGAYGTYGTDTDGSFHMTISVDVRQALAAVSPTQEKGT